MPQGPDTVAVALAILKLGGAYVPIDADFPPPRVRFMIEDTAARCVVTTQAIARDLAPIVAEIDRRSLIETVVAWLLAGQWPANEPVIRQISGVHWLMMPMVAKDGAAADAPWTRASERALGIRRTATGTRHGPRTKGKTAISATRRHR